MAVLEGRSARLTWSPVPEAAYYEIYRGHNDHNDEATTPTDPIAEPLATDGRYLDATVKPTHTYHYQARACNLNGCSALSDAVSVRLPVALNDTGIAYGDDDDGTNRNDCVNTIGAPQDCDVGRDAAARQNTLSKTGDGVLGFDFTKLDNDGHALDKNAPNWRCVRDNHTGYVWEVKTEGDDEHHKSNTYAWDNLHKLVDAANNNLLCGIQIWRVPTLEELRSIIHYGDIGNAAIDITYFPHTRARRFWTSSRNASEPDDAWQLGFGDPKEHSKNQTDLAHARLIATVP